MHCGYELKVFNNKQIISDLKVVPPLGATGGEVRPGVPASVSDRDPEGDCPSS